MSLADLRQANEEATRRDVVLPDYVAVLLAANTAYIHALEAAVLLNIDRELRVVGYMPVLSDGSMGAFRKRIPKDSGLHWQPVYSLEPKKRGWDDC